MANSARHLLPIAGAVIGALMTFAMLLVALLTDHTIGGLLFAILFGVGSLYAAFMAFQQFRHQQDRAALAGVGEQERRRVLKLAAREEGYLTAEETAMDCNISIQQAEALLDDLVEQGSAQLQVSESGSMVYVFPNLLEDDKTTAEDPMKMLEP